MGRREGGRGVRRRRVLVAALAALVCLPVVGLASPAQAAACAEAAHDGGDWPMFGQSLSGDRHQTGTTSVDPGALEAGWTFSLAAAEEDDSATFNATPVVAGGCVYIGSSSGTLYALNAESGEVVWSHPFEFEQPGLGGAFVSSVAVEDGVVFAHLSEEGAPKAAALDAANGTLLWQSASLEDEDVARIDASAVPYEDKLFVPMTGGDAVPDRIVPFAILDAGDGEVLEKTYVITPEELERGYAGGGIWGTAVVDADTGYAYVGTANPYSKKKEHPHTNALLKIDLDDERATFGQIVDAYKGDVDQYFPGLDRQPVCQTFGDDPTFNYPVPGEDGFSLACAQLDIDFGASPNLFTNSEGRKVLGNLQKSGVYHAVYADTMQRAWTSIVSYPSLLGNSATTAVADGTVFASAVPGQLVALDADTGGYRWVAPIPGGGLYQALSTAGGVVYGLDVSGALNAYDAETGILLAHRPSAVDTGSSGFSFSSSGISIARDTVYAAIAGHVVAYR